MPSEPGPPSEAQQPVHFVVKYNGILYITTSIFHYDPNVVGLSPDQQLAIAYLNELLGRRDVALLDNSVIVEGGRCVNEVMAPE